MFCENFAPHKSKYSDSDSNTTRTLSVTSDEDYFVNKPEPPLVRAPRTETHLTEALWSQIRASEYYARDYEVFSKIKAGPFVPELYMSYPPPQNAMR